MSAWAPDLEERARALVGRYPEPRSALGPLLYLAMRQDGYLSEEGMRRVAELTGITPAQVEAISIESYWVPVPGGYTIKLSPSSGAWVAAAPGIRARIVQVIEQAENRLVIVELEGEATLANDLAIAGDGSDWQSSSYSQIGDPRWTLDFRGETLPDPVVLVVRGVGWIEVPGGGPVDLERVPR